MQLEPRNWVWILGAVLLSVVFVVSSYFLSRWVYSKDDVEGLVSELSSYTPHNAVEGREVVDDRHEQSGQASPSETVSTFPAEESSVSTLDEVAAVDSSTVTGSESSDEVASDAASEYPRVPEGYPLIPPWKMPEGTQANISADNMNQSTLLHLVLIKLWNQGDHDFVAGVLKGSTGKVYPLYPNTLYVRWGEVDLPDGTKKRYIRRTLGPPGSVKLSTDQLINGEIPVGVKIIDMDSGGIDATEFF
ncbi:MAG: hypothetical protein O7E52_22235 [Candidatus Poribacteria bacterium]|nr:hypothetical protein [Candidatus Poribacteria bacterium]